MWLKNSGKKKKKEWWKIRFRSKQKALSQLPFTHYDLVPDKEPVKGTGLFWFLACEFIVHPRGEDMVVAVADWCGGRSMRPLAHILQQEARLGYKSLPLASSAS